MKKSFGTVLNCIDGRVQIPVIKWMKKNFDLDYVDVITEPGMDRILSEHDTMKIIEIQSKVMTSITAHNSKIVAVVGHHDCAGNPVSDKEHIDDIKKAICVVQSWGFPVKVIGLWVDEHFHVHLIIT